MSAKRVRGLSLDDHTKIAAAIHRMRRELHSIEALAAYRLGRSHKFTKVTEKALRPINCEMRNILEDSLFDLPEIAQLSAGDRNKFLRVCWPGDRNGNHDSIDGEAWLAAQPVPEPWWDA
jgi:hypothetical protein